MKVYARGESAEDRYDLHFPVPWTDQVLVRLTDVVQWLIYLGRLIDGLMHGHGRSIGRMKATFGLRRLGSMDSEAPD
jgi:hypothetical protein